MANTRGFSRFTDPMERFNSHVTKTDTCWLWDSFTPKGRANSFMLKGRTLNAARASYTLHKGEISAGCVIMHSCDNPACVNPSHLFEGTQADNLTDMRQKKRERFLAGSSHANSRLSESIVREARVRRNNGERLCALAREYGVAESTLHHAISGKTWSHVA